MPKLKPYSSKLDLVSHQALYGRIKSQGVQLNLDAHFSQTALVPSVLVEGEYDSAPVCMSIVQWMEARALAAQLQAKADPTCPADQHEIREALDAAEMHREDFAEFLAASIRLDRGVMLHGQADPTDFIAKKHEKGAPCFVVDGILMTAMVAPDGNTVFGFCDLHDCQLRGGIVFITPEGEIDDAVNESLAGNHSIRGHWEFRL